MPIFSVSFYYPGPSCDLAEGKGANQALSLAEKEVESRFKDIAHEYCWPDGSLYKYVKAENPEEIRKAMEGSFVHVSNIVEENPEKQRASGKRLKDLFT